MNNAIIRPEKITKFLSHMFPAEKDRLYFEMSIDSIRYRTVIKPDRIELEMPTNAYIIKYNSLTNFHLINDSNTPNEIHANNVTSDHTIIIDMCNTTKTRSQQLNFINRLYGATVKTNKSSKESRPNLNSYIFVVKNSLCKSNSLFKTYALTNYNDEDYVFTEDEDNAYDSFLNKVFDDILKIYNETGKRNLTELVDIYLQRQTK
jgi:hypothetical protein